MDSKSSKRRLAAIIFTDIVGYTPTMEKDEEIALNLLKRQRELIYPLVETYEGKVLKEIGDSILIMFDSAISAIRCAIDIQKEVKKKEDLLLRVSLHIGEVIVEEDNVFGPGVNIVTRMNKCASPGGICISKDFWQQIRNQPNLMAVPLGMKVLKGVREPVEIFELKFDAPSTMRKEERIPIFKNLLQRNSPQILGVYLMSSWGILEFVDWLVNRYVLSSYLVEFSLVLLLSMLPTVSLLAYFHGRVGQRWTKVEKIGIPTNLLCSIALLFFIFHGKDLGSAMASISLVNEEGQKIERVIPKSEFRKKIFLFFFDNESKDSTLNWLQYAITDMLGLELYQDIFLDLKTGRWSYYETKKAGFPDGIGLPLTLKQKIAYDEHLKHFLSGSFTMQNGSFSIITSLYETKRCKLIVKRTFEGNDIFKLLDDISIQLKYDLKVPKQHIEEVKDLPISEMMTNSISALRMYIFGMNAEERGNYEMAMKYYEAAIKEDSTFADAYNMLALIYYKQEQKDKEEWALNNAMKYIYKLSERHQFWYKRHYYSWKEDANKMFALSKMIVDLYPEDIEARLDLARRFRVRNQFDEAISQFRKIKEIDPEQYDCLREVGNVYAEKGAYKEAMRYYEQYANIFPNDCKSYTEFGDLYKIMGEYEKAKTHYEKALLIEPGNIYIRLQLSDIDVILGNYDKAFDQYQELLKTCKTQGERSWIYRVLLYFYELKGQMKKSLECIDKSMGKKEKEYDVKSKMRTRLYYMDKYIKAEKKEKTFQILKTIEENLMSTRYEKYLPIGYLKVYLELGDAKNAEKALKKIENTLSFYVEWKQEFILEARGKIHEIREEYEQATHDYEKWLEIEPTNVSINTYIGRCYRKRNNYKKAERYIKKTLKILPFDPNAHYEIALIYADMGNKEKALEHLKKSLYVWEDADPDYQPAKRAREKLADLESTFE